MKIQHNTLETLWQSPVARSIKISEKRVLSEIKCADAFQLKLLGLRQDCHYHSILTTMILLLNRNGQHWLIHNTKLLTLYHWLLGLDLGINNSHRCIPNFFLLTKLEDHLLHKGNLSLLALGHVVVLGQIPPFPWNVKKWKS